MARPRKLGYGEGSVYFDWFRGAECPEGCQDDHHDTRKGCKVACDRQHPHRQGAWRGAITINGHRRRVSAPTRSEVVARLDVLRHDIAEGMPTGDDVRLGPWIDWWLANVGAAKSPATVANDRWALDQLDPLRGKRLRELTVADVEHQLRYLATRQPAKPAKRGGARGPLGRSALVRVRRALGEVLHEAERRDVVARNVARLARVPVDAKPPTPRRSLSPEEADALVGAAAGAQLEALVTVGLYCGLRPGELTGLPWDAIDFRAGTLTVRQSRKVLPDGTWAIGATKAASDRVQRIPANVVAALKAHRKRQTAERLAAAAWEDHALVFCNEIGRPIDPSNLRRDLAALCERAGVKPAISPNELRHSAASLLVARGVQLEEVADFLGHANVRMLAQVYRHRVRRVVDLTAAQAGMLDA